MNKVKRLIFDRDLPELFRITFNFVGRPIKSTFNKMFDTYPSRLPNNAGEVSIFVDPTASTGRLDITKNYGIGDNVSSYSLSPDIWIGEVNLFDRNIKSLYEEELSNPEVEERSYFIVLRRLGNPSVNYCIENKLDNVYISSSFVAQDYYKELVTNRKYPTLDAKLLKPDFVDANWEMFNILDK